MWPNIECNTPMRLQQNSLGAHIFFFFISFIRFICFHCMGAYSDVLWFESISHSASVGTRSIVVVIIVIAIAATLMFALLLV